MAKGKYSAKAENRNWEALETELSECKSDLKLKSEALHKMQRELLRLRALESIFDGTREIIAELEQVRAERDKLQDRNFVLQIRVDRWGKMLADESNAEFLRLTPDLWADLAELGYFKPTADDNRGGRRVFKTSGKFKKAANIGRNGGKVVVSG
jgi:alkylation response protein AidB-like acyl-CoA dehydrogenase